ncbi:MULTISPECIES: hypothetical protein [Paenibacillus]|nr:hypothetical protein [Paenibacillus caseinilyticus]MCZ8518027.1 hypothetical protein [Paenibacillus caseinilyticus]
MNHFELEMRMKDHLEEIRSQTKELRYYRLPLLDWLIGTSGALILAGL